ncbi:hypothetical protein BGX23_006547 [Mortierella sp. AD031]|nr:hypothetical protein BGX23_006547 [Mortierella sp. AD031]KAG0211711.1 hypothetical protein BGX33_004120 [Mortierella sp. NVP41]
MERNNISPEYQWLDGRRYHNNASANYLLPNDIDEVDRLQLQHFILRYAIQGNYRSPLDKSKVRNILDVGCGPGTWTMEMANEFPDATVTGIDLSAVFPSAIIPGNCRFLQHNVLEPFPFPDNHFDFVYQRLLISGLTADGWVYVIKELERITKPGGWIELVEVDSHGGNNGPHTMKIWNWITKALATRGIDSGFIRDPGLASVMIKTGVENVTMVPLKLPLGKFGGKIGVLLKENLFAFWNAITPMIVHGAGADKVEYEEALRQADREVEEYKSYHIFYVVTGQKREDVDGAVVL